MVAVLCVARSSIYKTLDVDCFDIDRDARSFKGTCAVVAHPPCRAWSAFCSHQAKPLPGEKDLGPLCVEILKRNGGVLEHPAYSRLWDYCKLPKPGWEAAGDLWSMEVDQSWFGDKRSKKTWLLISGVLPCDLPEIPFRLHDSRGDRQRWNTMSKNQRAATPLAMAEWLISVAKTSRVFFESNFV